jgi:PIN domain nuclease of toxin-antitoxin system
MSGYLLDTHTAIWYLTGDALLSPTAARVIRDSDNRIYLSMVSAWELAIKIGISKLRFPGNAAGFIQAIQAYDITNVPIKSIHLSVLETLPMIHRDPFDRLFVATAISEEMTIITTDKNIPRYDVSYIW